MNNSNPNENEKPRISGSVATVVDSAIETYFQPLKDPMHVWLRFLCAWLGSMSIFMAPFLFGIGPQKWITNEGQIASFWIFYALLTIIPSIFGFLVACAETKHGPVRLYLSGMLLSTFTVVLTYGIWTAGVSPT